VEEAEGDKTLGPFPFPRVLRLVRYIAMKWRNKAPRWSRRRVLERDQHQCVYCRDRATTIDHVVPTSRGGGSTWMNTVASCRPCNNSKGSRTAEEAGLVLRRQPFVPSWWQVMA